MTGKGTILVVDDSGPSLRALASTLQAEGYQVRPADSGALALASVAASAPDLVLLDVGMPGLDGLEVCRLLKIREDSRDIPVIFLSASTEMEERVEGLRLGAVDFISKPFQRDELLARVATHLELGRLRRGLERRILALTKPIDSTEGLSFDDLFNLGEIQAIQDAFAAATGVASIITDPAGAPITRPSGFCALCRDVIRKTEKGLANCQHSDAVIGRRSTHGPTIQRCLSGGLWDGAASIMVGHRRLATWRVGQVLEEGFGEEKALDYADEIGADREAFRAALAGVSRMPKEQFEKVCQAVHLIAGHLSNLALQNVQQARTITERSHAEVALRQSEVTARARAAEVEALMDAMPALTFIAHDPQCRRMTSSRAAEVVLRVAPGANTSRGADEVERPTSFRAVRDGRELRPEELPVQRAASTGEPQRNAEVTLDFGPDGQRHILGDAVPLFDELGAVRGAVGAFVDITERKRTEEALRKAEGFSRTLLENLADGVVACDAEGKLVLFNRTAREWHGLDALRLPPGEWSLYYHLLEEDGKSILKTGEIPLVRAFRGEEVRDAPMVIAAKGQAPRTVLASGGPMRDDRGQTVGAVVVLRDVTESRRSAERLRRSEERLRGFFDSGVVGSFVGDLYGRVSEANGEFLRIVGLTRSDLAEGRIDLSDLTPEEFRLYDEGAMDEARESGSSAPYEKQLIRQDGSRIWVLVGFAVVGADRSDTVGFVADISAKKEAEEEIRSTAGRYRTLTESMKDVVWILDPQTMYFRYVSPSVELLRGFSAEEILAAPVDHALTPAAAARTRALISTRAEAFRLGTASPDTFYTDEVEQTRKNGSTVWTEVVSRHARSAETGDVEVRGVSRDITERRQAEAELRALHAALEQRVRERTAQLEVANAELESFSYSVSHDLRAPLRAIEGFSAVVVQEHGAQLDDEGQRLLGLVRSNAVRMAQLIDDLLSFSRMGRSEMRSSRIDMTGMARTAYDELIGAQGGAEKTTLLIATLPEAQGDPGLVRQVWVNLLSNAVKFSSRQDRAVVEVEGIRDGNFVVYSVRDNGTGFDMKYADKLFGVFQRLHGRTEFEGTGVGLALVKRIVVRHGGWVRAFGEVGTGATVTFALPAADESGPPRA